ncbi:MAG: lytic transglycosylase domain-containing protein [Bacteroidales bacterium]|nr:lytic transglycosylase domain-containing protein [Candidatus Latescibacterota bacterium]
MLLLTVVSSSSQAAARDVHVWRGEYAKAVPGMHHVLQREDAPYLVMAGELGRASEALRGDEDELLKAFISFRAEEWSDVIESSIGVMTNPWLETYRKYMRSSSFLKMDMPDSAISISKKLLTDYSTGNRHSTDTFTLKRVMNIYARSLFLSGRIDPNLLETVDLGCIEGNTLVDLAVQYFSEGLYESSNILIIEASGKRLGTDGKKKLEEILLSEKWEGSDIPPSDLARIARGAIGAGLSDAGERVVSVLEKGDHDRWEASFLHGLILEKMNRKRAAKKRFKEIFNSSAPIEIKKNSLLRIASIDYSLRRMNNAAANYRMFGVYYPDDARAENAIDISARIKVAQRKWDKAIDTWDLTRRKGPVSSVGRNSVISEAALCIRLGRRKQARSILNSLMSHVDGRSSAAAIYWMYRASDDPDSLDMWKGRLEEVVPASVYSLAMENEEKPGLKGIEGFVADEIKRLEVEEREEYEAIRSRIFHDRSTCESMLLDAFDYLIDNGLLDEASELASVVEAGKDEDEWLPWYLYCRFREKGMIGESLSVLHKGRNYPGGGKVPIKLLYPVAYSGLIAEYTEKYNIPPELVLSVIREESSFDDKAVSPVGAVGLMQLMPSTGRWIGEKLKIRDFNKTYLSEPCFNISAGTWYLRFLLDRCEESIVGALAAYNAGNRKMSSWKKEYDPSGDPLLAMELIGIKETREYVRRVMSTMAMYRNMYMDNGVER